MFKRIAFNKSVFSSATRKPSCLVFLHRAKRRQGHVDSKGVAYLLTEKHSCTIKRLCGNGFRSDCGLRPDPAPCPQRPVRGDSLYLDGPVLQYHRSVLSSR